MSGPRSMLSGTASYALRAVVYLASQPDPQPVRASELARAVDVPRNYLGKILHELVRAGILKSRRGKGGGFELAVPPEHLTLLQVAARFDRLSGRRCLLGRPACSENNPCPVHARWRAVSLAIERFFDETTVADIMG
ncbi:MAG: Rrf2 family transcriptional regulator [Gemmatimonadota bacterium]|nr:MAG: Rrf2 family transcriptional regulator [Gemmatimonadota bacterium]